MPWVAISAPSSVEASLNRLESPLEEPQYTAIRFMSPGRDPFILTCDAMAGKNEPSLENHQERVPMRMTSMRLELLSRHRIRDPGLGLNEPIRTDAERGWISAVHRQ